MYTYSDSDVPTSPTTVTDALGNVTSTVYDTAGNVCLTGVGNLWSGSTPPTCTWQQGYTLTLYDPIGRKTMTEDQSGNKTTYSYGDPLYPTQPTQMVLPGGATSTVSYNLDGETATSTDAPNSTISYGYDLLGLKCWQAPTTSTGSCTAPPKVTGLQTFAYYNSGSLASTTNVGTAGTKTASYTYDAQQNLLSNTNENGQTVSYAYTDGGQVSCIAYPIKLGGQTSNCAQPPSATNAVVDYTYHANGRMKSVTDWLTNTFDATYTHSTSPGVAPGELQTLGYNCASASCTSGFANGSVTYGYDPGGNLTSEQTSGLGSGYSGSWTWTYNADNLIATGPQGTVGYNSQKQVTGPGGYSYTPNGEIQTQAVSGGTDTYSYNSALALTSVSDSATSPATVTSYGYTPAGQRCFEATGTAAGTACSQAPTGATLYSWSPYQQLCSVGSTGRTGGCSTGQTPTAGDVSYTYGADGLRTTETSAAGTTEAFSYDLAGSQPLVLTDGTNAYIYGPANFGADTPPLEEISLSTGQATAIVSNPTGPEATVTNGGAQGTYVYGTYGTQTVSGTALAFGFQGSYQGSGGYANALLYMVNRYYDPSVGQFISVDPAASSTNQPYVFVGGDPINRMDPLGLHWCDWMPVGCGEVTHHWRGIVQGIGITAGIIGLFTGVGAIAEGGIWAGITIGAGAISTATDLTGCFAEHNS